MFASYDASVTYWLALKKRTLEQNLNHTVQSTRFLNDEIRRQKALLESDENAHSIKEKTFQTNESVSQRPINGVSNVGTTDHADKIYTDKPCSIMLFQ